MGDSITLVTMYIMEKNALQNKYNNLIQYLQNLHSVCVAFSAGVDSTFLLYAAKEALGDNMMAVTADTALIPAREASEATEFCKKLGIKHVILKPDVFKIEGFSENPANRCYICKKALFSEFKKLAEKEGMAEVVEGSNLDDNSDYRPGHQAIKELGILSPLRECGFTKQDIRELSKEFGLPTWEKPSFACLASRIPYGDVITSEKLGMVEQAEDFLIECGFKQFRVRIHGRLARIEIKPEDFERIIDEAVRVKIYSRFKKIGFDYTALDLLGYRSGSLNETLKG